MKIKQVIIIRKDLNMRKGKMAAQAAHASMKIFLENSYISNFNKAINADEILCIPISKTMKEWILGDYTKIVVGCNSKKELINYYEAAKTHKLPCSLIKDAGYTEFDEPTYTAVAIGPADADKIDKITGHLKLL